MEERTGNTHQASSAGRKPENPVETDSSWGVVRHGGARTTSLPLQTGWGIEYESESHSPDAVEEFGAPDAETYLSKMTKSASLERRTKPAVPSFRINCTFSLQTQTG